jgi:protein-S-isoprenylcysteine O-methyltransferase Ste14
VWTLFISSPMTLQTSGWYASAGYVSLAIVGAIALYGFWTALGGRRFWTVQPSPTDAASRAIGIVTSAARAV